MNIRKTIAAILTAVMLMCSVQVPAGADMYYSTDSVGVNFDSPYLLSQFLSQESITYTMSRDDGIYYRFLTMDSIPVIKAFEDKADETKIYLTNFCVGVVFADKNVSYSIEEYYGNGAGNDYAQAENYYNDKTGRERFGVIRTELGGKVIYYQAGRYYFIQDGKYYSLGVWGTDNKYSEDNAALCEVVNYPLGIRSGWHTFGGTDTVYRDKKGTTVTKPTVIDGKLYKFDKNGVCKGLYTGFANTKKGKVYYSKGVLVKNKVLKFRNGTRYKADKNGILTKI